MNNIHSLYALYTTQITNTSAYFRWVSGPVGMNTFSGETALLKNMRELSLKAVFSFNIQNNYTCNITGRDWWIGTEPKIHFHLGAVLHPHSSGLGPCQRLIR